jgi:hypothetical protein
MPARGAVAGMMSIGLERRADWQKLHYLAILLTNLPTSW